MKIKLLFLSFLVIPGFIFSQLVVNPTQNVTTVMNGLLGGGVTYSNVQMTCPVNAMGTFTATATNLGLNNGIMLTTGSCATAIGPNNSTSAGVCNGTLGGDPQLSTIEPLATYDMCRLEFDIVPQCNTLQIRFVFGSEEYPEFVSSSFNDAFGFFITGPGPACQPNFYTNTNVATLPNNVTPVTIDNVNNIINNAYYVNNTGGATIQYDGFTTVLTRTITVCPCQTYHFKIVIADAGDCIYDSGVFIDFMQCSAPVTPSATFTPAGCSCSGTATASATGGTAPYQYSWVPSNQTTQTITGLCPGTYTVWVKDAVSCSQWVQTTVTVTGNLSTLTVGTSSTQPACFGGCNGTATANPSGGTAPYTYLWSPTNQTTQTATGLCAGTYTVTVTDANGCTGQGTIVVTQPTAVSATQSQTNVSCNGGCNGTATVVASGGTPGYTYNWAPSGGNAATATGLCAGTYTVTITDSHGCTTTRTFTITQPPVLNASQSQTNVSCNGGCNGTATVVASGGTPGYSYNWAPSGGNAATATGLCAGTYTVTITDANGCTRTNTFTITQPTALTASQSQLNINCNGQCTGTASVTPSGGTPGYTYNWVPSGGNAANATGLCAGNYTVTITDANGCTITRNFTITQPTAITATQSQTNVSCNGGCNGTATVNPSGGTPGYTYNWAPSGGNAATATGLCAGSYTVTITDANGCTRTNTFTITQPPVLTVSASSTQATCGNSNGTTTANPSGGTPGYSYLWTPTNQTTQTSTGLPTGTYTVVVTDANGCTATTTVTVTQPSSMTLSTSATQATCGNANGSATVTVTGGNGPYTYLWNPSNQTTSTATGLTGGNYTVTVTDANGCTAQAVVNVPNANAPTASTTQTNILCFGGTASATVTASGGTAPYTYLWTPTNQTTTTATGLTAGNYTVVVTDANGCTAQAVVNITQPTQLTATQSQVNLLCNAQCNGTATVVASGGTPGYSYNWAPSGGNAATATGLCAGTYTVTITDANGCTITRNFTITEPTPIVLNTSFTQATCGQPNGTATVVASGGTPGYTYSWAPSGGNASVAIGLSAGSYTVYVTDANGCTAQATVVVPSANSPTATISASTNVLCFNGNNGSATVTVTGGTAPYTYLWNPSNQTTSTATGLTAGNYTVTVTDANGCTSTATVTITQPTQLTVTNGAITNVNCFNACNGSASVTANGGTPNYTYNWAPSGGNQASATGLCAGTYTVTITDANGCTVQTNIAITQPTQLTGQVAGFAATCFNSCDGQAVIIPSGGTQPYSYNWAPNGGNTPSATGLCAGTYTITVTDANGCTYSNTVVITQPTAISLTLSAVTANCNQADGSANVVATGGTPLYTYSWAPNGGSNASATGLTSGTYTVFVTDANGCVTSASILVPNANGVSASISAQTNTTCFGSCDGTATALPTGGTAPYNYLWSSGNQTTQIATGLCAGTYTVTITDAVGCFDTAIVVITQPTQVVINVPSGPIICISQCTTLTATASGGTPGYTYSWAPNGPLVCPTVTTTYTVFATDANGCLANPQTVTVTVRPPLNVTANPNPATICVGASSQLSAVGNGGNGGPYTYVWIPGNLNGQTVTVSPTATTTYTVILNDGCSPADSVAITVNVNQNPQISFFSSDSSGCAPLCVNFTDNTQGALTWNWTFNGGVPSSSNVQTPNNICYNTPGLYSVSLTVTDNNGCSSTYTAQNMIQVYANPVAAFTPSADSVSILNPTICFTDASQNATSWTWSFGDISNNSSNLQNPCHTFPDTGRYCINLSVENINGCRDSISYCIIVNPDFTLFVPNAFTPSNGDGNNDTFFPKGLGIDKDNFEMWIFDRWGNMIWYTQRWGQGWDGRANGGKDIAQEDTYVWKIVCKDLFGVKHSLIGHVSIIK